MTARRWGILLFHITGIGAAGYLTYTHFANVAPICSGLGDCAYVQASSYAKVLGIPIALLGLLMYLVMLALTTGGFWWLDDDRAYLALQVAFGLAFAGTLYSAYLTYIEAFVLHAYCVYCILSAISITAICVLTGLEVLRPTEMEENRAL